MKSGMTPVIITIAVALGATTSPALAYRSKRPTSVPPKDAAPQPVLCLGFSKRVVELVNVRARAALDRANGSKSYEEAFINDVVVPSYAKLTDIPLRNGKPIEDRPPIALSVYYDLWIPGLKPDTSVPGAPGRKLPAVSFDKGVTTLKSALETASKNNSDAFKQCFPDLADFMGKYDARSAEYKRRTEAAAAEKRRQEAERQSPHGQVLEGYVLYRLVRHCNEVRRGYVLQYVNDEELRRATAAIQAIVKKAKNDEPSISTDNIWSESGTIANGRPIGDNVCRNYLQQLLQMSPVAVYDDTKPPE